MEASTRVIPLLHHYPVSTEPDEMWEHGNVVLGFDAEERLIQKLPNDFAAKVVWGSRYPHHDATSAWDAMAKLRKSNVPEPLIARMLGQNAADQQRWMSTEPVCAPPVDDGLLAVQQRQLATSLNGEITAPLGVEQPLAARTLA